MLKNLRTILVSIIYHEEKKIVRNKKFAEKSETLKTEISNLKQNVTELKNELEKKDKEIKKIKEELEEKIKSNKDVSYI